MKKINKKFLLMNSTVLSAFGFLVLTSCTSEPLVPPNNDTPNPPDNGGGSNLREVDLNIFKTQLPTLQSVKEYVNGKSFEELFNVNGSFINSSNFKQQLTSKQFSDQLASNELEVSLKEAHSDKFFFVNAVSLEQNTVRLIFGYQDTEEYFNFEVSGFKAENNFIIQQRSASQSEWGKYVSSTQKQRYEKDMEQYDQGLERNSQLRETNIKTSDKQKFDLKANELGVPTYDRSNRLGMTIPEYDSDGKFIGLNMQKTEAPKTYSWVDGYNKETFKNIGLARTITNEQYAMMATQTYQFKLTNWSVSINENERNLAKGILKNDDKLVHNLFEKIKDSAKKQELKDKLDRNIKTPGVVDELISQGWNQILAENSDYQQASSFYDEYIIGRQNLILDKMNNTTGLSEKTKVNITKRVKETTNFRHLENWYRSVTPHAGTAWIIDHELVPQGQYPKKFYFATNLHVLDGMDKDNFENFQLTVLNENNPSLYQKLETVPHDDRYVSLDFAGNNKLSLKRIFDGRDYLQKDPSDFLADKTFDKKEFIDFAVFEVDFRKTNFTEEQIRSITNNYADKNDKKVSFVNYDYLHNYKKIDIPLSLNKNELQKLREYDSLFALGYPQTQANGFFDFFLDKYEDEVLIANAKNTYSLWTNASYDLYKKPGPTNDEASKLNYELGYGLSYALGYRTFIDKPGIVDQFLNAPLSGAGAYRSSDDGKEYVAMNLGYMPRRFAPGGGASGSSVRNQENKLVGIFHSVNQSALTGIAAAFRSEGFNYQELYGSYNLPQYDVIYGGGKDQKVGKSYREALLKENPNLKTHLFPNGLNTIPEEFKFKNS